MPTLLRLCDSCTFYNEGNNSCRAFPQGIPLKSDDPHFEVREDQVGDTVYDLDPSRMDWFDMYRRIHPQVKFPLILSYEIPEDGDDLERVDAELEVDKE